MSKCHRVLPKTLKVGGIRIEEIAADHLLETITCNIYTVTTSAFDFKHLYIFLQFSSSTITS